MTKKDTNHLMMHNLTNGSETNVLDSSQRNMPSAGLSMLDNIDGAANNKIILDAKTLHQLQVRLSQSSQKRFIFFDRCGGKNRIYVHPSLLKDLSGDTGTSDPSAMCAENEFHGFHPVTEMLSLKQLCSGDSVETSVAYKWTMPSSFAAVNEIHNARESSMFLEGMQSSLHPSVPEINANVCTGDASWEVNKFIGADVSNSSLFNDTDDLEALLSTDDEASTGQSPGDNNAWASEIGNHVHKHEKVNEGGNDQKRENDLQDVDGDSTGVSFAVKESKDHCPWTEHVGSSDLSSLPASASNKLSQFSEKAIDPNCSHGSKLLADAPSSSSEFSSSSSALKRKHSVTSLPLLSGSAKKSRSNQIKQTVRLLRSIIPGGGDHVDTAFVLDKAIQYVISLQQKVQGLEESRHLEINK